MKKSLIGLLLIMLVFIVGCIDYKAYDIPQEENNLEETSLVDEIAAIEEELALQEELDVIEEEAVVEEEIVLPELTEDVEELEEAREAMEHSGDAMEAMEETSEELAAEQPTEATEKVITVKENELVRLRVNITDPDQDAVQYSFSKPVNRSGEWQTNYGDAGGYIVTLTATDGKLSTSQKIKIVVERVNVPPVVEALKDLTVNEGKVIKLDPKVSDPNDDPVTITVSEPLASGRFTTDHTSAGQYKISVTASDGELQTVEEFTLTINDVNELPVVSGLQDLFVEEGDVVKIDPKISDLDGDQVEVTISEPVGNDGVWETQFTDHGQYTITVTIDDGKDTVTETVVVTVEDVNKAPEIIDIDLLVN